MSYDGRRERRLQTDLRLILCLIDRKETLRIRATDHWDALLVGEVERCREARVGLIDMALRLAACVEHDRFGVGAGGEDDRLPRPPPLLEDDRAATLV